MANTSIQTRACSTSGTRIDPCPVRLSSIGLRCRSTSWYRFATLRSGTPDATGTASTPKNNEPGTRKTYVLPPQLSCDPWSEYPHLTCSAVNPPPPPPLKYCLNLAKCVHADVLEFTRCNSEVYLVCCLWPSQLSRLDAEEEFKLGLKQQWMFVI